MRTWIALLMLMSISWSLGASATTTTTTTAPSRGRQSYSDRYAVLSEHNIFLRERSRPTTQSSEPARKTIEELLVLTGIVAEDDGFYRAYFENEESGDVVKVSIGEKIGNGVVSTIALDAIEYDVRGQRLWVETGNNLKGKSVPLAASRTQSPVASTTAPADATAAKLDPNDPNLSVEQRMRLRRQQETNRR